IVVDDPFDVAMTVHDPRMAVGTVAFGVDAFVPVMMGRGAFLPIDRAGPRIFPRRLVEMPMNDQRIHAFNSPFIRYWWRWPIVKRRAPEKVAQSVTASRSDKKIGGGRP